MKKFPNANLQRIPELLELVKRISFFYVPFSFRMWTIMGPHNFLYFVALSKFWFFTIPHPSWVRR